MPFLKEISRSKWEVRNGKLDIEMGSGKNPTSHFKNPASHILPHTSWLRGFTLIETVISLFLIIAIITILLTTSSVQFAGHGSNLQGTAVKIASRQTETLRKAGFSQLPASGAFTDPDLVRLPQGSAQRTIDDYQLDPDIKQVTIQVNWVVGGAPREIRLETLIYKNGL